MVEVPLHVPKHMQSTYILFKKAFPSGIPSKHYLSLLAVMKESGMSDRAVAEAIACYYGNDYINYLHDVAHVLPNTKITHKKKQRIREILQPYGYEKWANEEE